MKTEVYSWRVSTSLKSRLEREARRRRISLASTLDLAAQEWLRTHGAAEDDAEEQKRLHEAAARHIGTLAGGNPRLSESVREIVRERLRQRHERTRPR